MYSEVTNGISVSVEPTYLEDQSSPEEGRFVWAYQIKIENHGDRVVQLLNRHWQITDGNGRMQEVKGPGVVGEQPVLEPGESFEYASGCPLTTPSGFMHGTYEMAYEDGERIEVVIPMFSLDSPHAPAIVH